MKSRSQVTHPTPQPRTTKSAFSFMVSLLIVSFAVSEAMPCEEAAWWPVFLPSAFSMVVAQRCKLTGCASQDPARPRGRRASICTPGRARGDKKWWGKTSMFTQRNPGLSTRRVESLGTSTSVAGHASSGQLEAEQRQGCYFRHRRCYCHRQRRHERWRWWRRWPSKSLGHRPNDGGRFQGTSNSIAARRTQRAVARRTGCGSVLQRHTVAPAHLVRAYSASCSSSTAALGGTARESAPMRQCA
mmetsp:Transcript_35701/g.95770  ORF Transcript_35701/g.95770 Transcript_35701/m.95770 type:complete len:244 (-) Transcript_35701:84-815(-)